MLRNIKKFMLFMILFITGFSMQCQQNNQNSIALKMIEFMQECINLNNLIEAEILTLKSMIFLNPNFHLIKDNNVGLVHEQYTNWKNFIAQYEHNISQLHTKNYFTLPIGNQLTYNDKLDDITQLHALAEQYKVSFARVLNEYITHFGQVFEKRSGLLGAYTTRYYISSKENKLQPITSNEYLLLMKTLHNVTWTSNWKKLIYMTLPVTQENHSIIKKNLTLNEIIAALEQVPLPGEYSTAAILAGVAATAAVGTGVYYAYNNMNQLKDSINQIENYFSYSAKQVEPAAVEPTAIKAESVIVPVVEPIIKEPTFLKNAHTGFRRGVYGDEEVIIPNWQAGGDGENYSLSGYSGQQALGTVAVGGISSLAITPIAEKVAIVAEALNLAEESYLLLNSL